MQDFREFTASTQQSAIVDRVIPGPSANNSPLPANLKKTAGRRKIPIHKIEKKQNRQVTFTKRKTGLFRKATELSTLCGSDVAVIVFSDAGKAYTCGNESVCQRFLESENAEAILWRNRVGGMGLNELKLYANYLQNIRDIISAKATSMAAAYQFTSMAAAEVDDQFTSMAAAEADDQFTSMAEVDDQFISMAFTSMDDQFTSMAAGEVDDQFDGSLCHIQWEDDGPDFGCGIFSH